jgi:hypothetical protein
MQSIATQRLQFMSPEACTRFILEWPQQIRGAPGYIQPMTR